MDSQQPPAISSTRRRAGAPLGSVPANRSPSHRPDLIGQQFGSVKIISPEVLWLGQKQRRHIHVVCECVTCGYRVVVSLSNLQKGRTGGCKPCGNPPPEYPSWLYQRVQAMRARCNCHTDHNYPRYGGRGVEFRFSGVKAATLWIMSNLGIPENFRDMHLDRIDPYGHYESGNLRWLSPTHNQHNKRGHQASARMHRFRIDYPQIRYSDATLRDLFGAGLSDEEIAIRFHRPSRKPKGKYGTYSTPDHSIASLVRDC